MSFHYLLYFQTCEKTAFAGKSSEDLLPVSRSSANKENDNSVFTRGEGTTRALKSSTVADSGNTNRGVTPTDKILTLYSSSGASSFPVHLTTNRQGSVTDSCGVNSNNRSGFQQEVKPNRDTANRRPLFSTSGDYV